MVAIEDGPEPDGTELELIGEPLASVASGTSMATGADADDTVATSVALGAVEPPDDPDPTTGATAAPAMLAPDAPDTVWVGLVAIAVPRGAVLTAVGFDDTAPVAPVAPDEPESATGALMASE